MFTNCLGPTPTHTFPSLGKYSRGAARYFCETPGFNKVINHVNEAALFIPDTMEMTLSECRGVRIIKRAIRG